MNIKPVVDINISSNTALISHTARYVSNIFLDADSSRQMRVCFAIEALLEYRMENNMRNLPINIKVYEGSDYFSVVETDRGLPYAIPEFAKTALDNGLVDSYSLEHLGSAGQKITLTFKYSEGKEEFIPPEIKEFELLDTNFSCRLLTDSEEDMLEAIKCLYSAYGYDYMRQDLYYFDSFKRRLNSGAYWAIICENEHHQVVGHCALDNSSLLPGIPEFCCLVTKPAARGMGIAKMLLDFAIEFCKEKGLNGVFICPVAYHPYTQKAANGYDFVPCCVNANFAPPVARGDWMDGDLRASEVMGIKAAIKDSVHTIYSSENLNDFIKGILEADGVEYEIINTCDEALPEESEYLTNLIADWETGIIQANQCGKDLKEKISEVMKSDMWNKLELIDLYLNLSNPYAISAFPVIEELGYEFAGFLPGSEKGDFALFQCHRTPYPMESLVLEPNYKAMVDKLIEINN